MYTHTRACTHTRCTWAYLVVFVHSLIVKLSKTCSFLSFSTDRNVCNCTHTHPHARQDKGSRIPSRRLHPIPEVGDTASATRHGFLPILCCVQITEDPSITRDLPNHTLSCILAVFFVSPDIATAPLPAPAWHREWHPYLLTEHAWRMVGGCNGSVQTVSC